MLASCTTGPEYHAKNSRKTSLAGSRTGLGGAGGRGPGLRCRLVLCDNYRRVMEDNAPDWREYLSHSRDGCAAAERFPRSGLGVSENGPTHQPLNVTFRLAVRLARRHA